MRSTLASNTNNWLAASFPEIQWLPTCPMSRATVMADVSYVDSVVSCSIVILIFGVFATLTDSYFNYVAIRNGTTHGRGAKCCHGLFFLGFSVVKTISLAVALQAARVITKDFTGVTPNFSICTDSTTQVWTWPGPDSHCFRGCCRGVISYKCFVLASFCVNVILSLTIINGYAQSTFDFLKENLASINSMNMVLIGTCCELLVPR
jgi:hypothetical protein